MDRPETVEEARNYRYGRWAGNNAGHKYVEGCCIEEMYDHKGWHHYQCTRKIKKDGLCGIHYNKRQRNKEIFNA